MNKIDSRGIGFMYKFKKKENPNIFQRYYDLYDINLDKVCIAESVPILKIIPLNYVPNNLYYNENLRLKLKISNLTKRKAKDFLLRLKIDYENAFTQNLE